MSMRSVTSQARRGSMMVEFVIVAIPLLFVIVSLWWMCLGMWQYHTVVEAANYTARIASVHGAGCAGQTCATTVASIAQMFAARAIGIPASQLNVTLTSSALTVTCNPLTTCYSNSSSWPSLAANTALTTQISIVARFTFSSGLATGLGHSASLPTITLAANATEPVEY